MFPIRSRLLQSKGKAVIVSSEENEGVTSITRSHEQKVLKECNTTVIRFRHATSSIYHLCIIDMVIGDMAFQ